VTLRIRLASGNRHKLEELQGIFPEAEIALLARDDYPPEDGATYVENARIKARFGRAHASPDEWAIGEDSGVEATALGGRPGIHSARWADDGIARILDELGDATDRTGRYVCAMVAIAPDGSELVAEGFLEGTIDGPARGTEGFGYDPIFTPRGETRTVAELGNSWKQDHSHRACASAILHDLVLATVSADTTGP
jgi:XTP/dITP diphosphohydrolase